MGGTKSNLTPGDYKIFPNLPVLLEGEMLTLPPVDALKYLRNAYGMLGIDNHTITAIISQYRDGASIKEITSNLRISMPTVITWVKRASQLHIVRDRGLQAAGKSKLEKSRELVAAKEVKILSLEEKRVEEDTKLADALREKAWDIYQKMSDEKMDDAKLKDQVDALTKLITTSRLLSGQSTVNTSSRSIVEHITRLNTMTLDEKQAAIKERKKSMATPVEPADPEPEEPDEE